MVLSTKKLSLWNKDNDNSKIKTLLKKGEAVIYNNST